MMWNQISLWYIEILSSKISYFDVIYMCEDGTMIWMCEEMTSFALCCNPEESLKK